VREVGSPETWTLDLEYTIVSFECSPISLSKDFDGERSKMSDIPQTFLPPPAAERRSQQQYVRFCEIVERVTKVGLAISNFKAGDLVGVGCLVDSGPHLRRLPRRSSAILPKPCAHLRLTRQAQDGTPTAATPTASSWMKFFLHIPANLNLAGKNLAAELDGSAAVLQRAAAIGFRHNGSVK
jgi:hypothetical protein